MEINDALYQQMLEKVKNLEQENAELKSTQKKIRGIQSSKHILDQVSFNKITDKIPGNIAYLNSKTLKYEYVNEAFLDLFSVTREEIIGFHLKDVVGDDNFHFALDYINIVRKGTPISYENSFELNNGKRWLRVNYAPFFDELDNVVSIIVLAIDITEKKQSEIDLRINEEKYRFLIEESSDPLFSFTYEGKYTYVNKAFADFVQKDQNFIIGNTIWDVFPKDEADKRYIFLKKTFDTGESQVLEVRVPNPAGDMFFLTTVTPIKDDEGNVRMAICISKNITSRKRAEIELKQSEEFLRIANSTKDKFFSIIAHDLRNPFNSILGFVEILISQVQENDINEIAETASIIHSSSKNAFKLLENLLEWSSIQTGIIEFKPENLTIKELTGEILSLSENILKTKNISIVNELPNNHIVYADKNMLNTILRNLISNAIKYTHRNGCILLRSEQINNQSIITISDNGIGMNKTKIRNLFKISSIESSDGTENEKGSGLGLILCKEFIEKHGGNIWVESEEGISSQFKFSLPMKVN